MQLGVSKEQIEQKQKQLKNGMYIESVDWYQGVLKALGFSVTIIDADWCFTTFLCKKEKPKGGKWIQGTYLTGW